MGIVDWCVFGRGGRGWPHARVRGKGNPAVTERATVPHTPALKGGVDMIKRSTKTHALSAIPKHRHCVQMGAESVRGGLCATVIESRCDAAPRG